MSKYLPYFLVLSVLPIAAFFAFLVLRPYWGYGVSLQALSRQWLSEIPQVSDLIEVGGKMTPPAVFHPSGDSSGRAPRYLQSIFCIFILPDLLLIGLVWKRLQKIPFLLTAAAIAVIGWAWSWMVTYNQWWLFGEKYMLGLEVFPHMPIEEILFYPFGGILCVFFYASAQSFPQVRNHKNQYAYWSFLVLGLLGFGAASWVMKENGPSYLISQLLVYNLLCCFLLAPLIAKEVNLTALSLPILLLGATGYFWDFFAVRYGWWEFYAVTQIRLSRVPLDEFNFFFFGPTSAVSIYLALCRFFRFLDSNGYGARVVEFSLRQARRTGISLPEKTLQSLMQTVQN